jgi:hypothetical protein
MALDAMSEAGPNPFNNWGEDGESAEKPEPAMRLVEDPEQSSEDNLVVVRPKTASQIAADAIKSLKVKPGKYIPPEITAFDRQRLLAEAEEAQTIKKKIDSEFGTQINYILDYLSSKEGSPLLAERRISIKNTKLLDVLLEHGYIDETMHEEGSIDTGGFIAARLLASKEYTDHQKYLLVGGHKKLAKEHITDEISKRDLETRKKSLLN